MKTATFRAIALDETGYWNLPSELNDCRVYGVYFYREGDATYCCSMLPSSWLEPLENVFIRADGQPLTDEQSAIAGELAHEGLEGQYRAFLRSDSRGFVATVSEPREFEIDPDDSDQQVWGDARESFQANAPSLNIP